MAGVAGKRKALVSLFYLSLVAADTKLMKGHVVCGGGGTIQREVAHRALFRDLVPGGRMVAVGTCRFRFPGAPVVLMNKGDGSGRPIIRGKVD